ncbi:MAG: hypothetical protein KBG70_09460 [Chitinophagales bacterium]|nr:hypothetical protein [Chitinophagales bacterium]
MKKILFYFIGLFLTHFCSAQIVQATDLLKMHSCTNYDCANSLIVTNGYLYSDTPIKQEGKTGYLYTHPTEKKLTASEQSTINVYHTIVYELNESSSEMVIYYFYGDEEYQDLLKQLETLGFKKLFVSDKEGGFTYFLTSSPDYPGKALHIEAETRVKDNHKYTEYTLNIL